VEYVPSGRPGHRVPHVPITLPSGADFPSSTIDLCADSFALLVGPAGKAWLNACQELTKPGQPLAGVPVQIYRCCAHGSEPAGTEDPQAFVDVAAFLSTFGVNEDGVVLCRPDGHNAFRAAAGQAPEAARQTLADAFATVLCTAGSAPERVLPLRLATSPSDLAHLAAKL